VPTAGSASCGGSFTFVVNANSAATATQTATISQCDVAHPTCPLAAAPTVSAVTFVSNVATTYVSSPPGLLGSNVTNGTVASPGLALSAVIGGATGGTVSLVDGPTGSFIATPSSGGVACPTNLPDGTATPGAAYCMSFPFSAKNIQGTTSNTATATVVFLPASNLTVTVKDAKNGVLLTDYRWIIEEDRTFWADPKCQQNTTVAHNDSYGKPCPIVDAAHPVESLGYNFHTASMPVIAQGCVGPISCELGQTINNGNATSCDIGNGVCRTDGKARKDDLLPGTVYLDPKKRYFISVLPGDGVNPTIGGAGGQAAGPASATIPTTVAGASATVTLTNPTGFFGVVKGDLLNLSSLNGAALAQATGPCTVTSVTGGSATTQGTPTTVTCTVAATASAAATSTQVSFANIRTFDASKDCGPYDPSKYWWQAGNTGDANGNYSAVCGHEMGGTQIAVAAGPTNNLPRPAATIAVQQLPLPTAKISVFVYEDDNPLNGENDAGGGVDVLAPNEAGLGGFEIKLFDQGGGLGDNTGQITYDEFNQPVSNALAGKIDPITGLDSCPITARTDGLVGMIPTCPKFESDGTTPSPLAGQAIVANLYPGLYEIQAYPAADRIGRGEEWLQTNTLDGGKPHEAFIRANEPGYFQEFGPGGFHVSIGFANPAIINARKAAFCANNNNDCSATLNVQVSNNHMSRTPDQRTYDSETYDHYSFTQCYVSVGPADGEDFAFKKCEPDGTVSFTNMPKGVYKLSVFDQWNDIMLDGLVSTITIDDSTDVKKLPVTQWRTNLFTRTFIDQNGDGVSNLDADGNPTEPGLALVNTNIRYRDGSFGFYNNTDLNGFAGWNEVFPFMNWLVVETTATRFKQTGVHTVYDAGGPVDCSSASTAAGMPCSVIAGNLANTLDRAPLPADLKIPGARYCDTADCATGDTFSGGSTGVVVPPQPWGNTQGWQGLLGQNSFMEFGVKPFNPGENGGIHGNVIYASTRPFDDPSLSLQLQWEPGVARVKVNLYRKEVDASGNEQLVLVDTTQTTSWDDWAQGVRKDSNGNPMQAADGSFISNMNCPGQSDSSPFFATLKNSTQWLDTPDANGHKKPIAHNSQFKCYDGWSQLNQIQPAPYDGMYNFPSVTSIDAAGKPAGTNCTACVTNTKASPGDWDYQKPMLPAGKYVVEVVVPPGYELVKEEDKNILLGDVMVAPVTVQFPGVGGNIFIMPDQAAVNSAFNRNSTGNLNLTNNLGSSTFPRHEGDTGSIEAYWPCVGAERIVPDLNSLYPGAGQAAPFAGATRRLCDRKEVALDDQSSVLAKFYVFSSTHIAGHFTGTMTDDFASEFDPFSPQFGEKFGPPNLPVGLRDFNGNEVARVYSDQWGVYNGLYFSSWSVNPPNPTGYAPQMSIACMNDPGPIADPSGATNSDGTPQMITDPAYNPAYSNFCYEQPFMPGFTTYMDTPVIPTQAFADQYNLPDSEYPDGTPAIKSVKGDSVGPWVSGSGGAVVASLTLVNGGSGYTSAPSVSFGTPGTGASATTTLAPAGVASVSVNNRGSGYTGVPGVTVTGGAGSGAVATASMRVGATSVTSANGSYSGIATPTVTFSAPSCTINGTTCIRATGTATMSNNNVNNGNRRVTGINLGNAGLGYTSAPSITFSTGPATATATLSVDRVTVATPGTGYVAPLTVAFANGGGTGAAATALVAPTSVASITLTNGGSGYTTVPTVTIAAPTSGTRATASATIATAGSLTIVALGDKVVQNPNFAGPNANTAPYNQKTITRHYDFGSGGTVALVGSDNVERPLTGVTWSTTQITGTVPTGLPNCTIAQRNQPTGQSAAKCGQLVIRRSDNGKQSIDSITVTIGGSAPWIVSQSSVTPPAGKSVKDYTANFGRMGFSPIQTAIDSADPGDLIIVQPGSYRENLIMWKPVRLQGVGASLVTVNADAHPAGKMDQWRRQVNCLFGLTLDGTTNPNDAAFQGADPLNSTYSCPAAMYLSVDRIPFEAIVGWDASGNGNLAQVLQEPTLMGAYEGAGITVLGRGMRIPASSNDFWGQQATGGAGAFTDGSVYLGSNTADCAMSSKNDGRDYGTSNFYCNPSSIDGISVINSSQGGGGIFVHGWAHNLQIANTRISANHGTLAGAINLGNGETPDAFVNDQVECNVNPAVMPCPPTSWNGYTPSLNAVIPFQFNTNVRIHHNMLYNNASIGDALFSGTPAGAGAITVSAGADGYQIDHNWIAGNLSSGDGGGLQHLGLSFQGKINNNYVLFNQSTNPTLPTSGGGIVIEGANLDRTLNGTECGSTTDQDCPPGLGEGTGRGLVIDANLILGNSAESGSGGGLRIQQVNGSELTTFPASTNEWYDVTVTNNIIANNVAGWDGGGASIQDSLKVSIVNNTVVSNDTTASAGSLFKTLGAIMANTPPPGCTPTTDPTLPQDPSCTGADAPHGPQPAGLVMQAHTPNLMASLGPVLVCPAGYGYSAILNGDCRQLSKPVLSNDLFFQNRAFSVNVVDANGNPVQNQGTTTPTGTGLQDQQNLVALTPALNQTKTGDCSPGSAALSKTFYWDVGLRTDDINAGTIAVGTTLGLTNSIITQDPQKVIAASNSNIVGGSSPVISQQCNGARTPPESCTQLANGLGQSCHGYNAPAGASETTNLAQVFVFNGIKPTATVDEGHNWLNLTYGPLTLNRSAVQPASLNEPELMIASQTKGTAGGAYSLFGTSDAVNRGPTSLAGLPGTVAKDFFGNTRSPSTSNPVDIGAVEYPIATGTLVAANPNPLLFTDVVDNVGTVPRDLVLTNNGTATFTVPAVTISSGFTRVNTGSFTGLPANCGTTLNAGASCTIRVQWTVPTTVTTATGSVTIAGVSNSPVTVTANTVAPIYSASVSPTSVDFGKWASGTTSGAQTLTVTNTGNSPLAGLAWNVVSDQTYPPVTAQATALMELNAIAVNNGNANNGNRYTAANSGALTATVAAPSCGAASPTCVQATVSVSSTNSNLPAGVRRITALNINNRGLGYTSAPSITILCGGTACAGNPSVAYAVTLRVNSVVVTNGGSGYLATPSVNFVPPGAGATATVTAGAVSSIAVTARGSYTNAPAVTIGAPTGTSGPFTLSGSTCTPALAVGAACQINVTFNPRAASSYTGRVNVTAGATTPATVITPASVPLKGAGVASAATVAIAPNPLTITLNSVANNPLDPNDYSITGSVTLTNTTAAGGSSVLVSGVTVARTGGPGTFTNGPLAGPDTCTGASLAPGATCVVSVRYTVLPINARGAPNGTGTITVTHTGAGSQQVGQLIGVLPP
jgi:hypothetical protein